jgi:ribonuclease-3
MAIEEANRGGSDGLDALERAIDYCFLDRGLLRQALTHPSYANERGDSRHYERLEFLGDAVLGLIASEWLYQRYPEAPEGELAKLKSFLVSAPALSRYARQLGIGPLLMLGVGEDRSGGREKASILADATEALFCAVFLDGGLTAARALIAAVLERSMSARQDDQRLDAKTRLQELLQARGLGLPSYELVEEAGPGHDKVFTVECRLAAEPIGRAEGKSKKVAEQGAAAAALQRLDPA